ncbi:hypothetical protein BH11BAC2_BH11BAC2_11800 [soil metagenome]
MERKSGLLITFLLGAAAGAAVGYLLASGKSEEITADIKEAADKIKEEFGKQMDRGKDLVDEVKKKAEETFGTSNPS